MKLKISITNVKGSVVMPVTGKKFAPGYQVISLNNYQLKSGQYLISVSDGKSISSKSLKLN